MEYNTTAELQKIYFSNSQYSINPSVGNEGYDSLLQWPSNGYFEKFKPDAALLREVLTLYDRPQYLSVAEQVFGTQARQQKLNLKHLANILYERAILHARHLKEINRRLMDCHEKLSILKMHFPVDGGKSAQNLEKLIIQLEEQHRKEEIDFWKDTTEVRGKLFENAAIYTATNRRKAMLYDLEDENA